MLAQGAIVTYKESSRKLDGNCGIVEGVVNGQPNLVWVRWVGEISMRKENAAELEVV